jgi:hypothetical protein
MITKLTHDLYRREGLICLNKTSLSKGYNEMKKSGGDLLSLEDFATLRVLNGPNSNLCRKGSFVREGIIYFPNKQVFMVRDSSSYILALESRTILTDPDQLGLYFDSNIELTSNEFLLSNFLNSDLGKFMFGEALVDYSNLLSMFGIKSLKIDLARESDKSFITPIYLDSLLNDSEIRSNKNKHEIQEDLFGYLF